MSLIGYTYFTGILFLGIVLLLLEIFIPGFGVFGFLGIIMVFASIIMMSSSMTNTIVFSFIAIIIIGIFSYFAFNRLKKRKAPGSLFLDTTLNKKEGFISATEKNMYLYKEGVTKSYLRPFGKIEIDGEVLDATSENVFIPKDTKIMVVKVESNKMIVKEKRGE